MTGEIRRRAPGRLAPPRRSHPHPRRHRRQRHRSRIVAREGVEMKLECVVVCVANASWCSRFLRVSR